MDFWDLLWKLLSNADIIDVLGLLATVALLLLFRFPASQAGDDGAHHRNSHME